MPYFTGIGISLSIIVAVGAQNAFVLRQGVRREHLFTVVLICALSDIALISLGVSGIGLALHNMPWLLQVTRWLGVAFLLTYAFLALRRVIRPTGETLVGAMPDAHDSTAEKPLDTSALTGSLHTATLTKRPTTAQANRSWASVALTALAITWLNPAVYLDTVFLLGSLAQAQSEPFIFALGAMTGSVAWFIAIGYGAHALSKYLRTVRAWRIVDGIIAAIMIMVAIKLIIGF